MRHTLLFVRKISIFALLIKNMLQCHQCPECTHSYTRTHLSSAQPLPAGSSNDGATCLGSLLFAPTIADFGSFGWQDWTTYIDNRIAKMEWSFKRSYKRFYTEDAIHINFKELWEKKCKSNGKRVHTHIVLVLLCQS